MLTMGLTILSSSQFVLYSTLHNVSLLLARDLQSVRQNLFSVLRPFCRLLIHAKLNKTRNPVNIFGSEKQPAGSTVEIDDDDIPIDEATVDNTFLSIPSDDDNINDEKMFRWTVKRRDFVTHYARTGAIEQASLNAGLSRQTGSRLIKYQTVRTAIQEEVSKLLLCVAESEESVIARWATWANADVSLIFNDDWTLKPLAEIPMSQRRCIKKIKVTNSPHGRNIEVEMFDAHKANNDLAQMMGLLGKGDSDTTPPEETAKQLQQALQEIRNLDAISIDPPTTDEDEQRRLN
jgi:hypothetical protein